MEHVYTVREFRGNIKAVLDKAEGECVHIKRNGKVFELKMCTQKDEMCTQDDECVHNIREDVYTKSPDVYTETAKERARRVHTEVLAKHAEEARREFEPVVEEEFVDVERIPCYD